MSQRLGQVRLPHAGRSIDQDMLFLLYKETGGKVGNGAPFDPRVEGEVEPLQSLLFFEGGLPDAQGELLRLPPFDLVLDDEGEKGEMGEVIIFRLGEPEFQAFQEPSQFQLSQLVYEVMVDHRATPLK